MFSPDHETRKLLVSEHQAQLRRLAERPRAEAPERRFTLTMLGGRLVPAAARRWRRSPVPEDGRTLPAS